MASNDLSAGEPTSQSTQKKAMISGITGQVKLVNK